LAHQDSVVILTAMAKGSANAMSKREVRLEGLLGRRVIAGNNQSVGRLEEFRAERQGTALVITDYLIGAAGLLQRFGVSLGLLVGRHGAGYVARWDQLDISDPEHPRLTCPVHELRTL
jgi:Mg2+/Co2+ transporter CorC